MGPFSRSQPFDPARDIPSLEGKIILITGGNTGIGKQSALDLAKHNPSQLWIAARSAEKSKAAISEIKQQSPGVSVEFLELDLTSFASIKKAAQHFLSHAPRLDILLLNAGIMSCPPSLTKEGYEIQFGTNHVGHALLFRLLTPLLLKSTSDSPGSDVRVVTVSSTGHAFGPSGGIQFDFLKTKCEHIPTHLRYGQSKLANVLFARELARRYPQIHAASIHPGVVKTDLHQKTEGGFVVKAFQALVVPFAKDVADGAKSQLWACTAKDIKSGEYYEPVGVLGKGSSLSKDAALARKLWEWTEKELDKYVQS